MDVSSEDTSLTTDINMYGDLIGDIDKALLETDDTTIESMSDEMTGTFDELGKAVGEQERYVQELKDEIAKLLKQKSDLESGVAELNEVKKDIEGNVATSRQENEQLKNANNVLQDENRLLKKERDELKDMNSKLEEMASAGSVKVDEILKELETKKAELIDLEKKHMELTRNCNSLNDKSKVLLERYNTLYQKYNRLVELEKQANTQVEGIVNRLGDIRKE